MDRKDQVVKLGVSEKTTGKLPKLDLLRAISALIVVIYHYGFPFLPAGFGVLTFFVISGFLITHLLMRENQRYQAISLKKFYIRRSLRIFPALYAYWIIATLTLVLHHSKIIWTQAICVLLYINNYYQGLHGYPSSLFSHTWSLGVEEQFYLVWPAVFVACRNSLPKLLRGLLIVIPALWVYRIALHLHGVSEAYIYTAFETRIDAILVGCTLAIVVFTGVATKCMAEISRARYIPVSLLLLAGSIILGDVYWIPYRNMVGFAVEPLLIAVLIAQLLVFRGADWMDSAPISYLGRISYSTYLYQQMVLPVLHPRLPPHWSLIGCVFFVWVAAAISYEVVEKPFLKLKRRFEAVRVESRDGAPVTGEA